MHTFKLKLISFLLVALLLLSMIPVGVLAETAVAVDNFEQLSEKIVDGGEIVVSGHIPFEDTLRITKDTTIRFTGDNPYLYMDNS